MGIFIRILAMGAALWAVFVHYKATKNEEQLSKDRIELSAYQKKYHDAQARREIATEKKKSLRDDIRLNQIEAQNLREKLAKKRDDDADREWQKREKQERAKQARWEEQERAREERLEQEREKQERAKQARLEQERARSRWEGEIQKQERRIEHARTRLLSYMTPPRIFIPQKNDFGVRDNLNASWSATMRSLIQAIQKRDRGEIQELVKKLRRTAKSADISSKSSECTQEAERAIQTVSDALRAIKRIQELQKEGAHNGEN